MTRTQLPEPIRLGDILAGLTEAVPAGAASLIERETK